MMSWDPESSAVNRSDVSIERLTAFSLKFCQRSPSSCHVESAYLTDTSTYDSMSALIPSSFFCSAIIASRFHACIIAALRLFHARAPPLTLRSFSRLYHLPCYGLTSITEPRQCILVVCLAS